MTALTITGMTIRLVRNRIAMVRSHGIGSVKETIPRVILRLDTDAGISGWGEATPWEVFSGTAEAAFDAIDGYLRPHLLGADAMRLPAILQACDHAVTGEAAAKAAIEMAILDLQGKALGVPLHQLLGGKCRDSIPLSFSIADPDIRADIDRAKDLVAGGWNIFKVKTGFSDHRNDVMRLEALRSELGDIDMRVDYNQGLEPWDALRTLRDVESFRPTFIEQPVARRHLDCMAALTSALDTPVMADESVFDAADALRLVAMQAADLFSCKIMKSGGIGGVRKVVAIAEAAGIPCYGGTLWEGPIALTAATHMIAAEPNFPLGCEFYMPSVVYRADELECAFPIADGHVPVPEGPGLGLVIDEDILDRLTIRRA